MKKEINIFVFLVCFFSVTQSFAQWAPSGTNIFNTNTGNVGIGLSNPESKLHVRDGDIRITKGNRLILGDANVGAGEQIFNDNFDISFRTSFSTRMVIANNGRVGIATTTPSFPLDVNGTVRATSFITSSDERFKKDINKLSGSLEKLNQVRGVSYTFNSEKFKNRSFPSTTQYGVIAQDVQKVFPSMVYTDEEGYLSVNYTELIPVLIEAIKELSEEITRLKNPAEEAKRVTNFQGTGTANGSIQIAQNAPNPFHVDSEISFEIPGDKQVAHLFLYNVNGLQVKKIEIAERGKSNIKITGGELNAGIYFYAIVADGEQSEIKKMILTE